MAEQEVAVEREGVTLAGTLLRPEECKGVVLFLHGSGPMDRNQNAPGAPLEIFSRLAEDVAKAGFASLRYDKRGIGASGGDYALAGQGDLVADAVAWLRFVKGQDLGPVILCGHSEGTALAPLVARQGPVAGMILICPYAERGAEILMRQARQGDDMLLAVPGWRGVLARMIARVVGWPSQRQARLLRRMAETTSPTLKVGGQAVPVTWLRDFAASNAERDHADVDLPTLVLAAEHDVQCRPEDGARIAAMNPKARHVLLPGLSHILRRTERPGVEDYPRQIADDMDGEVGKEMALWLRQTFGGASAAI